MEHTHSLPTHTHGMEHTHQLPEHTHPIEYGIYEGPVPTEVIISVDGSVVPISSISADDIDLIPYLAKDSSGRITRGNHTIAITPNDLGRIVASVTTQLFVQSRGGGDY